MKKVILVLVVIGLTAALKAQNDLLARDGTTWQYVYTSLGGYLCYSWKVDGDTIADGHTYKKVYFYTTRVYNRAKADFVYAFREEENRIYTLPDGIASQYLPVQNGEVLLYDFSLQEGDIFPKDTEWESFTVDKVDYIEIDGRQRKRMILSYHNTCYDMWIEGIGSLSRPFGYPLSPLANNGESTSLEMFEQDGKAIYGSRRFNLLADGVHWTERTSTEGSVDESGKELFELQRFSVNGDSIINGISYKKIYVNGYPYMNLREDEDENIYYYNAELRKDGLLYQFNPQLSTSTDLHYTDDSGADRIILRGQQYIPNTMDLLGHRYVYFTMNESSYHYQKRARSNQLYLIFGVGLTHGIFQHIFTKDIDCICYNDLVSLYNERNELVYQNPAFKENGEFVTGISSTQADKKLRVRTQSGEATFCLRDSLPNSYLSVYGIDGKLLSTQSLKPRNTTVSLPSGTYIYRLQTGNANAEVGKFSVGK